MLHSLGLWDYLPTTILEERAQLRVTGKGGGDEVDFSPFPLIPCPKFHLLSRTRAHYRRLSSLSSSFSTQSKCQGDYYAHYHHFPRPTFSLLLGPLNPTTTYVSVGFVFCPPHSLTLTNGGKMSALKSPGLITVSFQKSGDHQDRQRPASAGVVRCAPAATFSDATGSPSQNPFPLPYISLL
jgi:hypothetical protein